MKLNRLYSVACFCMRYKTVFSICFSNNWYQSGLQSHVCITWWVSFIIQENCFHDFENTAIIFLHILVIELLFNKTDIDVMMLFKFDFNDAKLNLKTIASMKFSFDLNFTLIWSRDYVFFNWNDKSGYQKNLKKFSFTSFDRSRILFN